MNSEYPDLHVNDETSRLKTVILGLAASPGKELGINARVAEAIQNGTYPSEQEVSDAMAAFEKVLRENGVEILRPKNIGGLRQTFTRDIGFVIDDRFVAANMKEESRRPEFDAIRSLIDEDKILYPPDDVYVEGGDIVQLKNRIFVGVGRRTNHKALEFLKKNFPAKEISSFEMVYQTDDPRRSILHLDCAFQPVGERYALFYEEGFRSSPQAIIDIFGEENLIRVSSDEMYRMFPNIFSLSPSKVVSCTSFTRLNDLLGSKGIEVTAIPYEKVAILGGLLRCSTLPVLREN